MTICCKMESPIGVLALVEKEETLKEIRFGGEIHQGEEERETPFLRRAAGELREYFQGTRREFSIPMAPEGTEFQKKVWKALTAIPYGETRSYGEIAKIVGNDKASRAVGMANHNNPIPILIPCHRVIGKSGKLTGYAGGLEKKTALLELERSVLQSEK